MDCIREAEKYLWHYRDLEKSLDNAKRQIANLISASCPKGIGSPNLTGEIFSKGSAGTLNQMYQLARWTECREETEAELERLSGLFENLKEEFMVNKVAVIVCGDDEEKKHPLTYREFLFMWYIDRETKKEIARKLNYSERALYHLRDRAIQKFAIQLFGLTALKAV